MYAIVDCNNFYVSCERVFIRSGSASLWLCSLIMMVASLLGRRKLRRWALRWGQWLLRIETCLKKNNVIVCSSNYTLYGDMSFRVMETLRKFTPDLEVYSIDEAFLHLENRFATKEYADEIKNTVVQWTGIPVSIGIAPTKTLAKVANRTTKKNPDLKGIFILKDPLQTKELLSKLPVEDVWGIGRNITSFLNSEGIYTAWEFCQADDTWIKKNLSVVALRTALELRGIPCLALQEIHPDKKAIMSSRSFGRPVVALEELEEAIASYTSRAAEKMRRQDSVATFLTV